MSRRSNLRKLALTGFTTGLLAHCCLAAAADNNNSNNSGKKPSQEESLVEQMSTAKGGNFGYRLMDEQDLLLELNDEGLKAYNGLSPEGKRLVRIVASSRCDGENICKGLNACKT